MKTMLSKIPFIGWIVGGAVFAVVIGYSVIFFIPKTVQFSYSQQTCIGQLTLAPDLQKTNSDAFELSFENTVRIGNVTLASTRLCVEAKSIPEKGEYIATSAPFGGFIARKQFAIRVPNTPVARASDLAGKTISTAEPLTIKLTSSDSIHQYSLEINEKTSVCAQADAELSCDVASLGLAHGTEYTAQLYQSYKSAKNKVFEGSIATLQPLRIVGAPVAEGQTIYDAPTSFTYTFDQTIKALDATLMKQTGEAVATTISMSGVQATLTFGALERETPYKLTVTSAIAESGSSLASPATSSFTMSGGPQIASVSAGSHSVARSASIVVTFDQPIDASVEIAKVARVEGVSGSVRKQSDTQLVFTLKGGDCTAFNLVIDKGVKSASNGQDSKEAWKFSSRTICGSSWTIGSSLKGRAITAYSFGTGSKTILFTGGIHGTEPSGYTTMMAWVQYLQAYGDIIPSDKRVVIVPNTNPDGIAAGSRNNSRNVNVDRNFPTDNWSASIETTSGVLVNGGGTSPGSEPEALALINLTRQLKPRLAVSFHAQGKLVGANKFADSVAIGDTYAKTVGYKTMFYNAEAVMGYAMTGEFEDWMGEEMNIPAILIELPSASGNFLSSQLSALKKMIAV